MPQRRIGCGGGGAIVNIPSDAGHQGNLAAAALTGADLAIDQGHSAGQ